MKHPPHQDMTALQPYFDAQREKSAARRAQRIALAKARSEKKAADDDAAQERAAKEAARPKVLPPFKRFVQRLTVLR